MHKSHFQYYSCQKGFILLSSRVCNEKDHLNTVSMRRCFGSGLPFWEILVVIGGSQSSPKSLRPRSFPLMNEKASFSSVSTISKSLSSPPSDAFALHRHDAFGYTLDEKETQNQL